MYGTPFLKSSAQILLNVFSCGTDRWRKQIIYVLHRSYRKEMHTVRSKFHWGPL